MLAIQFPSEINIQYSTRRGVGVPGIQTLRFPRPRKVPILLAMESTAKRPVATGLRDWMAGMCLGDIPRNNWFSLRLEAISGNFAIYKLLHK